MKSKDRINAFHVMRIILPTVIAACPIYFLFTLLWGVLHGVFTGMITIATNSFFTAAELVSTGTKTSDALSKAVVILALCLVGDHIFVGLHNSAIEKFSFRMEKRFHEVIHQKAATFSTLFFESSDNLNWIQKASQGSENATFFINVLCSIFSYYIPYFVFMGVFLVSLDVKLIFVLFFIFIPELLSQLLRIRAYATLEDKSVVIKRKYLHYEECIRGKQYFKETRLLGAFSYFYELYKNSIQQHNEVKWKTDCKVLFTQFIMKVVTLMGYSVVLIILVAEMLQGEISVANFAALFTSLFTMFAMMDVLINGHITRLSNQLGSIRNLTEFLEKREDTQGYVKTCLSSNDIRLENVSFRYSGENYNALENISLNLIEGEMLAIVGENGSGKSTLVKIMTGIYPATKGNVFIGNSNINTLDWKKIQQKLSAVFQTYQRYGLDIVDNIKISNPDINFDECYIQEIIHKIGLKKVCEKLPKKNYTLLSREFGGVDLSTGQWQKVAIGRGMYKECELLILDEPTASIDPLEEARLYNIFSQMAKGKTSLLITHRLSAARLANKIAVLDHGKLIEYGTHKELMEHKGKYNLMYNTQKDMYKIV